MLSKAEEIVVITAVHCSTSATVFSFFQSLSCRCCWSSLTWSLNSTWRSEQLLYSYWIYFQAKRDFPPNYNHANYHLAKVAVLLNTLKSLHPNNHLWSLHTELQFSGWELAPTGKKNNDYSYSYYSNSLIHNIIMVLVTMGALRSLQRQKTIFHTGHSVKKRSVNCWYVFPGMRDIWGGALSGGGDGFEVGVLTYIVFFASGVWTQISQTCSLLSFRYLSGRVFVLNLKPGSQAYVDKFICPGDIIDEINGTSLRNSKNGQVSSNMQCSI